MRAVQASILQIMNVRVDLNLNMETVAMLQECRLTVSETNKPNYLGKRYIVQSSHFLLYFFFNNPVVSGFKTESQNVTTGSPHSRKQYIQSLNALKMSTCAILRIEDWNLSMLLCGYWIAKPL